jgi:hypothetical protein
LNTDSSFSLFVELCDIIFHSHHFSVLIYFRISKRLSFIYSATLSRDIFIPFLASAAYCERA